jgi:hypothetical protein
MNSINTAYSPPCKQERSHKNRASTQRPWRAQSDFISSSKLLVTTFDPDLGPKGALLRRLIGTPASDGHPDPADSQTPVFCRAAKAYYGRCVSLRPWLIHVDRRHCSYATFSWDCRFGLIWR